MIFKFNSLQLATSLRAIAVTSFICSTILCSPKLFFTLNVHYCDTMWQMWQECVVKIGKSVKCGKSVLLIVKFSTILCSPTLFFTLNVHYCDTMWQEKSVLSNAKCSHQLEVASAVPSRALSHHSDADEPRHYFSLQIIMFIRDYYFSILIMFIPSFCFIPPPLPSSSFVSVCPD